MKNRRAKKRGLQKRKPPLVRSIPNTPTRLYAIGDIHGCADEMNALLQFLKGSEGLNENDQVVFIGDYIDRGPASKDVIDQLIELRQSFPKTIFLKGNHEDMLLSFLGLGGHAGQAYLSNGGFEFFRSYQIQPLAEVSEILSQLPEGHKAFFEGLETGVVLAEFLFVHAGIRPARAIAEQNAHDLIWIRSEFTSAPHELGKTVVFGHTPYEDVLIHLPYKIGIDTGLVYGNKLTCVELVEGTLYQVDFGERDVRVSSLKDRLVSPPA